MNAHHEKHLGFSTTNLHGRSVRDFTSSLECEQMIAENTHVNGGLLDLVMTDVPDVIGIRVDSAIGTSDHSAVFIDVVLDQPIPHLVCRQEIYLKNSVYLELVTGM